MVKKKTIRKCGWKKINVLGQELCTDDVIKRFRWAFVTELIPRLGVNTLNVVLVVRFPKLHCRILLRYSTLSTSWLVNMKPTPLKIRGKACVSGNTLSFD